MNLFRRLSEAYQSYFENFFTHKRFTHKEILSLIRSEKLKDNFRPNSLGFSVEGREIFSLEYGEGNITVLIWTQMHGDEATATMALFDLMNFLNKSDEFNDLRNHIKQNLNVVMVPMLNPDGAERMIRQNAIGIDLNRDAKNLTAPESRILMELVEKHKPEYAFNMHDQDFRWTVGETNNLARISLLAPVFDREKSIDEKRSNAMKLVVDLKYELDEFIPGNIARYKDDFEPRSFGDTIAGKGVSVITIESGRDIDDPHKFYYRKLNFLMLVSVLDKIISKEHHSINVNEYFDIPVNGNFMFDLILRNVWLEKGNEIYKVDIAINREEKYEPGSRKLYLQSEIMEIGDLSTLCGIEEFDCSELTIESGKISETEFENVETLRSSDVHQMLQSGVLFAKINSYSDKSLNMPINAVASSNRYISGTLLNSPANFNLIKEGKIEKQVINGWLCEVGDYDKVCNGVAY